MLICFSQAKTIIMLVRSAVTMKINTEKKGS